MTEKWARGAVVVVALVALTVWPEIGVSLGLAERTGLRTQSASLDQLLDVYVRDGFVYYAALTAERAALDRLIQAFADEPPSFGDWPSADQRAFWLNAYNTLVLHTVVDHYPIRGRSPEYPTDSIKQISGAFDGRSHRVAGRSVTLDDIETDVLAAFDDPRLFLALGRGAVGSGRLRSEVFAGARLEGQLVDVLKEFATTPRHVMLDRLGDEVIVSSIFGWRETEFISRYADRGWIDCGRSPLERAILTMLEPAFYPSERAFLTRNRFMLRYQEFDWQLNDLTDGRP